MNLIDVIHQRKDEIGKLLVGMVDPTPFSRAFNLGKLCILEDLERELKEGNLEIEEDSK